MRKSQTAKLQLWNVCMNYNYILTNMCACEKFWENWRFSNVSFFSKSSQNYSRPRKKKPKKIMHPFSRLAFMNMEKKRIFCETAKKFNWCNTVFLYFWFLSHHFTYVLTKNFFWFSFTETRISIHIPSRYHYIFCIPFCHSLCFFSGPKFLITN
jgi:hypothetical protein